MVAVNKGRARGIAQQIWQSGAALATNALRFGRIIFCQATRNDGAIWPANINNIAAGKAPLNLRCAGRQQACAARQRLGGPGIDMDASFGG